MFLLLWEGHVSYIPSSETKILTRSESRVQRVNVNADVNTIIANPLLQQIDDSLCTYEIDISSSDNRKSAAVVIRKIIFLANNRCPNSGVDRGVENESLLVSDVEESSMIHTTGVSL